MTKININVDDKKKNFIIVELEIQYFEEMNII